MHLNSIWKGHGLPCLDLSQVADKIKHMLAKWYGITQKKTLNHAKIRNCRAEFHDFLEEIFDIFSNGLTSVKELSVREFYYESCHPQKKGREPLIAEPIFEIENYAFCIAPSEETGEDETDNESDLLPSVSPHMMRTRMQTWMKTDSTEGDSTANSTSTLTKNFDFRIRDSSSSNLKDSEVENFLMQSSFSEEVNIYQKEKTKFVRSNASKKFLDEKSQNSGNRQKMHGINQFRPDLI